MLNKEIYRQGMQVFEAKYINLEEDEYKEVMEDMAWNAFYNDNHKVNSIAEGYFLISEVYGDKEANKYLMENTTIERVA